MIQSIFPWKAPCAKLVLQKLGLLSCFEIDYPTEKDPEARHVEVSSVLYRKSAEKCGCTAVVLGCCTIDGPLVTTSAEEVEPSTSLFDPMTKLYRCLGLPGTESGCGKWCVVHGPNPDASNDNILCAPGAAVMHNCCGTCWADSDAGSAHTNTTDAFGFTASDNNVSNLVFEDVKGTAPE